MLMSSLNTAAVTTVQLVPTAANVAATAIGTIGTAVTVVDRGLNVADAASAKWERVSLASYKYDEKSETKDALHAAALRMASTRRSLETTLQADPTLKSYFDEAISELQS